MKHEMLNEILTSSWLPLLGIIGGILGAGGFAGVYYTVRTNKPKTNAEAQKINAEVSVIYVGEWQKLYQTAIDKVEAFEKRLNQMEDAAKKKDEDHAAILRTKNDIIDTLTKANTDLEKRVGDLEIELEKYTGQPIPRHT